MNLEQARKYIKKHLDGHHYMAEQARQGWEYYNNRNDIKRFTYLDEIRKKAASDMNPLRNADFRISHNWHQLLVNQKAAYLFTYAPGFDTGDDALNDKILDVLGADFPKKAKNLCISASNCGVGWLHCWIDDNGKFRYAEVPSYQVVPVYSDNLESEIEAVLRVYTVHDEDAEPMTRYEIWTDSEVSFYEQRGEHGIVMSLLDGYRTNVVRHNMGYVPFVPFYNNATHTGDLPMVKDLIDQYDLVVSGFANDLTDIQEVVFIIRNYGGENLNTFLSELKQYKAIKVEDDGLSKGGGVEAMQIEIPTEARVKFLDLLKRQIFISGQGVDPDPQNFGNSSGVALKYLYSLLEIKAGLLETEFRAGFSQLLKLIFRYLGVATPEEIKIQQVFIRNEISNDQETAGIAAQSVGIISDKTILQNHPWVEDAEAEMKQMEKERGEHEDTDYGQTIGGAVDGEEE